MKNRRHWLAALPLLALASACTTSAPPAPKPTFVLVHGAFQDERAWSEVRPRLEAAGHKVVAVRLAGRAGDTAPLAGITLDSYREQVAAVVAAEPAPVVLAGHSFGGITIAGVAEKLPERVRALVFVGAYLPQAATPDQSMAKLAEQDRWNGFTRENFVVAKDYQTAGVLERDVVTLFCGDCSTADQARTARDFHQLEPLKPAGTPVAVSAERYGRVPKVYVKTLRDRAISPQMQQLMIERTLVKRVIEIDSGHSPFLSQPQALAQALLEAAREWAAAGAGVTVVVTRRVRPGHEAAYEAALAALQADGARFAGYLGATTQRPASGAVEPVYTSVIRFAGVEDLRAFEASARRSEFAAAVAPHVLADAAWAEHTGLEFWFSPPPGTVVPQPVRWRMALVMVVVVYALVSLIGSAVAALLPQVPAPLRLLLTVALQVTLLTWWLMPRLTRWLAPWIYPRKRVVG